MTLDQAAAGRLTDTFGCSTLVATHPRYFVLSTPAGRVRLAAPPPSAQPMLDAGRWTVRPPRA